MYRLLDGFEGTNDGESFSCMIQRLKTQIGRCFTQSIVASMSDLAVR